MKTYHATQGALFKCSVLKNWEGNPEKGIFVYVYLIHFSVQQKLTQHSKATLLQ